MLFLSSLSPHIWARPFREVSLGKSHSIAGVRSSISPAQGSQASTAKTPAQGSQASTTKTPAQGRQASTAKNSCSRQPGVHGQSSSAQGRPTSTVSYLTCIVQSDRPPAMSPEFPEWPTTLPCVQFEGLYVCTWGPALSIIPYWGR